MQGVRELKVTEVLTRLEIERVRDNIALESKVSSSMANRLAERLAHGDFLTIEEYKAESGVGYRAKLIVIQEQKFLSLENLLEDCLKVFDDMGSGIGDAMAERVKRELE